LTSETGVQLHANEAAARLHTGELQLHLHEIEHPFRWSEDFGHFTQNFRGALFGVGAGQAHPQLHHPDYDFPDEIIITGTRMFYSLIQKLTA
ncbi:MAG TPA: hypothetical protein PLM34_05160, partial [Lentimicrobium sp.]|nr:hypothetical protein [Lentimicrobium sp.]